MDAGEVVVDRRDAGRRIEPEELVHLFRPPTATERRIELPAAEAGDALGRLQAVALQLERLLRLVPRRDVLHHRDMVIRRLTGRPQRRDAEVHPDDVTVLVNQALVHRELADVAALERLHLLQVGRQIVAVGDAHEIERQHFVAAVADDGAVLRVHVDEASEPAVDAGDTDAGLLEHGPHARLAVAQRCMLRLQFQRHVVDRTADLRQFVAAAHGNTRIQLPAANGAHRVDQSLRAAEPDQVQEQGQQQSREQDGGSVTPQFDAARMQPVRQWKFEVGAHQQAVTGGQIEHGQQRFAVGGTLDAQRTVRRGSQCQQAAARRVDHVVEQGLADVGTRQRADDASAGCDQVGVRQIGAQAKFGDEAAQARKVVVGDVQVEQRMLHAQTFGQRLRLFVLHQLSVLAHLQHVVEYGKQQRERRQQQRHQRARGQRQQLHRAPFPPLPAAASGTKRRAQSGSAIMRPLAFRSLASCASPSTGESAGAASSA